MAEMGILDLEVQVNLEHVEQNLGRLTEALRNVKEKVGDGIKLSGISTQILKICKAVDEGITGSTIIKLGEFGDALSKLKGLGDIKINFNTNNGLTHVVESVSTEANGIETIATTAGEEFERVESFIENIDKEVIGVKNDIGDVIPDLKKLVDAGTFKSWDYGPLPIGTNVADAVRGNKQSYAERIGLKPQVQNPIETEAEKLEKIKKMFGDSSESVQKAIAEIYHIDPAIFNDFKSKMQETADTLERVKSSTDGVKSVDAVAENARTFEDCASKIEACTDKTEELKETEEEAEEETHRLRDAFRDFKSGMQNMFPSLNGLIKKFAQIAKYRMLRTVLKYITSGFSEGVQNVYQYSKAIGSSFAPSMDSAATSILQMKNSIGAAVAPLIQSLIPVLQKVVDWFITLVNYVNQFFALMRGQATWTRAVPATTTAFGKQEKAAKGAANAMKDLLADWDELNIIQSQTSGSGAGLGTSDAEEYLNMFEEVSTFDRDVKNVVNFLKDNFDEILGLVEAIGAAILLWKISGAFSGILGTLAGLAGAAFTLAIVAEVSTMFTNEFFNTGDPGWLVGDIIATLVGGLFTKSLLSAVLGTGFGNLGFALAFAISAAATIAANVARTDIDALSEESILADITAALEGSVAGATLGYMVGGTLGSAIAGGAVGLLGTFGVAIGIKADAQVATEGLSKNSIIAKLLSLTSLGIAGATTGAKLASAGLAGAGAAGMAMLFDGVAIASFGVAVGINAVNDVVDGSGITADVVKKNFLSGGLIGAGLGIATFAVAGASVAGLVAVTAGALTIGALFAIESYIDSENIKVNWGSFTATKEAIEAFVEDELYNNPPSVTISLIDATLEPLADTKSKLEADATEMLGTVYALSVGVLTTVDDLESQIDALVNDFNASSEQYQNTLEVALSLVQVSGDDGTDQSAEILQNSSDRWGILNGIMAGLGEDLADAYKVAYDARMNGNIDAAAEETIKKISEMMSRVAAAISTGQAKAQAGQAIRDQIENLSKDTLSGILDVYKEQRDKLIEELTKVRRESAQGILAQQYAFEELARFALEDAGGNTEDEQYKYYMQLAQQAREDYNKLIDNLKKDVEDAADRLADEDVMERLRSFMLNSIQNTLDEDNMAAALASAGYGDPELIAQYMADTLKAAASYGDITAAKEDIQNMFDMFLMDLVGATNYDEFKKAIDQNILSYGDLFSDSFLAKLKEQLGITGASKEINDLWDQIVASIFKTKQIEEPEVDMSGVTEPIEEAKESAEEYSNTLDDLYDKIRAGAGYTGQDKIDYFAGLYDQFGSFNVQNAMRTLGIDTSFMAEWLEKQNRVNPGAAVTSGQIVNGTTYNGVVANPDGSVNVDEKNVQEGVKNGTSEGFNGLSDKLATVNDYLDKILKKRFSITFNPSSSAGFFVQNAVGMSNNVTGEP